MLLRLRLGQLPSPRHTCRCAQPLDISAGADTGCYCYNECYTGCSVYQNSSRCKNCSTLQFGAVMKNGDWRAEIDGAVYGLTRVDLSWQPR